MTQFERDKQAVDGELLKAWRALDDAEAIASHVWPDRTVARDIKAMEHIVGVLRDRLYTMREV